MRRKIKINPKSGILYLPKDMLESGFKGEVDAFSAGSVIVITHPDADTATIKESISLVLKDIKLTPRGQSQAKMSLSKSKE